MAYRDGPPISYDARPDRWNRLPPPPLGTRDVDQLVWSGERLVAFGCVETDDVCLARAAVLEPSGWRRLPDATDIDMWPTWEPAGDLVVNPTFGRINDEDPEYLSGGILDLRTGEWSTLPNPPSPRHWVGGAVLTEEVAHYDVDHAWIWAPP